MVIKDSNNEFAVKVSLSSERPNELRWTFKSKCAAFIVDVISDVGAEDYDSKYSDSVIESSYPRIVEGGYNGFSSGSGRKFYYVDSRSFRTSGSRFTIQNNGCPCRVKVYAVDEQDNIVDCGDSSIAYVGSLKLMYSVKSKLFNKTDLTVKFESSKGYSDSMAVYVVNVNGKSYQFPITAQMLNRELKIKLPSKQEFVVQATPAYRKVLKIEINN